MRAIFPLFAAACLLTFASWGRGEFDGTGVASTKPGPKQTAGATIDNRPAEKKIVLLTANDLAIIAAQEFPVAVPISEKPFTTKVREPLTHRPANIPSLTYVEFVLLHIGDHVLKVNAPTK